MLGSTPDAELDGLSVLDEVLRGASWVGRALRDTREADRGARGAKCEPFPTGTLGFGLEAGVAVGLSGGGPFGS